jgi:peptidoglycan biosynthesis protein MviN/MurJ (putative lipid II flippase)
MGILNSVGHFAAPAGAPILLNIFMIGIPTIFMSGIHSFHHLQMPLHGG